jgi:pilus assembly protein CpaC
VRTLPAVVAGDPLADRTMLAADPPAGQPPQMQRVTWRVTLPRLAMRAAPDMNAVIVAQVPGGDPVKALERSADGRWLCVQHGDQAGWVPARWLQPAMP